MLKKNYVKGTKTAFTYFTFINAVSSLYSIRKVKKLRPSVTQRERERDKERERERESITSHNYEFTSTTAQTGICNICKYLSHMFIVENVVVTLKFVVGLP